MVYIIKCPIWDSLTNSWPPPRGWGHFSISGLCSPDSSDWLHSIPTAFLDRYPKMLASPKCWGPLMQLGCPFTSRRSSWCQVSPTASSGLSQGQAPAALQDSFMPSKPEPPGDSPTISSAANRRGTWPLLDQDTDSVSWSRKYFPGDVTSTMLVSF